MTNKKEIIIAISEDLITINRKFLELTVKFEYIEKNLKEINNKLSILSSFPVFKQYFDHCNKMIKELNALNGNYKSN